MTEKFKLAVETFVSCNEKISSLAEAVNKNGIQWSVEKLIVSQDIAQKLAKSRDEAKEIILSSKGELATDEEEKWFLNKIEPYIQTPQT